jgi:hypothetical protein
MEYINPENDKYKIINLLFSCDQINFDLGYILSKNVKELKVDDIDIYFEHELNKKNYIDINNISYYIREQLNFYERKIRNLYITDEAKDFFKGLLKDKYKNTFLDISYSWGQNTIYFKFKNTSVNMIYYSDDSFPTFAPLFREYRLETDVKFTNAKDYVEKNNDMQEFLLSLHNIDFLAEYCNEKKEEIDELTDKIHFLQKMQELINNYNYNYPNYNNKVKKRYFYDKLKISSFPIVFGNKHNTYDFSVSINSIDKKYETCNVDVKKWKGSACYGKTWRRNFKKRNLSKLYNQIEDLINYDY